MSSNLAIEIDPGNKLHFPEFIPKDLRGWITPQRWVTFRNDILQCHNKANKIEMVLEVAGREMEHLTFKLETKTSMFTFTSSGWQNEKCLIQIKSRPGEQRPYPIPSEPLPSQPRAIPVQAEVLDIQYSAPVAPSAPMAATEPIVFTSAAPQLTPLQRMEMLEQMKHFLSEEEYQTKRQDILADL